MSVNRAEVHTHLQPAFSHQPKLSECCCGSEFKTEFSTVSWQKQFPWTSKISLLSAPQTECFVFTRTYRIRDGSNWDDSFSYLKSHLKSAATFLLCNCSTERWVWTASPLSFSLLSPSASHTVQNKLSLLFHKAHRTRALPLNHTQYINVWKWQEGH